MFPRPYLLRAAALAALLATTTSCGLLDADDSTNDPRPTNGLEVSTIRVAVTKAIDTGPLHLAIDQRLFKKVGLNVEAVDVDSGGVSIQKLIGNDGIDLAYATYGSIFIAQSKNAAQRRGGLKLVADSSSAGPGCALVVATPESKVKDVGDLADAKVAVTDVSSLTVPMIQSTLKDNRVNWRDVDWVQTTLGDTPAALARGRVDAAFVVEPFIQLSAKLAGALPIVDVAQGRTDDMAAAGYAATDDFVRANPNVIAAFQKVMAKATSMAVADRALLENTAVKYSKVDADTAKIMPVMPTLKSKLDATRIQRAADLLKEFGIIATRLDVSKMIVHPAPTG
jgi:NitT/TauT family transport system substrate-binding protein